MESWYKIIFKIGKFIFAKYVYRVCGMRGYFIAKDKGYFIDIIKAFYK
jgi:hypothetical protein